MNDKRVKININESVSDSMKEIGGDIMGMVVVAAIVGCLVAPFLACFIEAQLWCNARAYPKKVNYTTWDIPKKMVPIKIFLWIICIISWIFVFWCNTP